MKGKKWKNFMAKLYGWGASVVILGALFKIQHWPGAGIMLTIGLTTEAVIFFFSAFEKPHEEPDWSLVYPELAGMHGEEKQEESKKSGTVTEELDKMLEEAKIGPELLQSLGEGLRNLSSSANKLSDMSDAAVATNDYSSSLKNAALTADEMSKAYAKATSAITSIDLGADDGQSFGKQLSEVSQKLSSLNAVYELQLQGSNDFLKSQSKLHAGITDLMENLNASVSDTKKFKEEVGALAENLSALNTVYGNMLTAMGGKK